MKKLIGLLVVFAVAATMAYAADDVTATGEAKAKIIQAATLTHETGALDFGTIIPGASAGTSTVAASASPSPNDSNLGGRVGNTVTADHFTLANLDTATTYTVSVPASVNISNGSETMTVDLNASPTSVNGTATQAIYVGGVLHVGASQAVGSYSANYTMTVTY